MNCEFALESWLGDLIEYYETEIKIRLKKRFLALLVCLSVFLCYGCGFLVGAAAGGAGGYMLRDKGYEVQSPVKKE
jgi:hypothetical protein